MTADDLHVVVMSDHGYCNGGAAQVVLSGLNRLAHKVGHLCFVAAVGPVDTAVDPERIEIVNFDSHDLLSNPSRWQAASSGIWNRDAGRRVSGILAQFDPRNTIVHVHTWTKSLSSSVLRSVADHGFKSVLTLHDYFAVCPNGGLHNYVSHTKCDLTPMSPACVMSDCDSRSYTHKVWRVVRHAVQSHIGHVPRAFDNFITVSTYSEQLLRARLPSSAAFFRVPNPISIERQDAAHPGQATQFSFVGRLSPEKGCNLFAAAAKIAGVKSVFIGEGIEEKTIRRENPHASLTGWLSREQMTKAIRASRAIVFPSLWHETQGMVVLEAAALGVPAVVSTDCAASEAIIDGKTGLLFRCGDVADLADKLRLLHHQPGLAEQMGAAAYARYWQEPPTVDRHVDALLECYLAIMNANVNVGVTSHVMP